MDIGFKDIKEIVQQGMEQGESFISFKSEEGDFQTIKIGAGDKTLPLFHSLLYYFFYVLESYVHYDCVSDI